mmetsp:Transcript_28531/g.62046  ORF Transcript_28531/g.62046 Transcript_28531/m.62046 type:complete len:240 (+) Transcript_28531:280-999(+)
MVSRTLGCILKQHSLLHRGAGGSAIAFWTGLGMAGTLVHEAFLAISAAALWMHFDVPKSNHRSTAARSCAWHPCHPRCPFTIHLFWSPSITPRCSCLAVETWWAHGAKRSIPARFSRVALIAGEASHAILSAISSRTHWPWRTNRAHVSIDTQSPGRSWQAPLARFARPTRSAPMSSLSIVRLRHLQCTPCSRRRPSDIEADPRKTEPGRIAASALPNDVAILQDVESGWLGRVAHLEY